jgi:hypothetical protein
VSFKSKTISWFFRSPTSSRVLSAICFCLVVMMLWIYFSGPLEMWFLIIAGLLTFGVSFFRPELVKNVLERYFVLGLIFIFYLIILIAFLFLFIFQFFSFISSNGI